MAVKPFESKRARFIGTALLLYGMFLMVTGAIDAGFFTVLIAIATGWAVELWVKQRKRRKAQEAAARAQFERERLERVERMEWEKTRPERMERELNDIKEQLRQLGARPPSEAPAPFTGSIRSEKDALELYELQKPFTTKDLKARRNQLLQGTHPDRGGSTLMARLVNEAFEILRESTTDTR